MRAAEEAPVRAHISAEVLMEQAGAGIARSIATMFFPRAGKCIIFAGKGPQRGRRSGGGAWL